jgi:hypothetical protein
VAAATATAEKNTTINKKLQWKKRQRWRWQGREARGGKGGEIGGKSGGESGEHLARKRKPVPVLCWSQDVNTPKK